MQFIVNPDLFPGFCASFVVNSVDRNSSSSNSSGEKMRPLWHDGPEDNDATLTAAAAAVGSTPKCYWGGQKKCIDCTILSAVVTAVTRKGEEQQQEKDQWKGAAGKFQLSLH